MEIASSRQVAIFRHRLRSKTEGDRLLLDVFQCLRPVIANHQGIDFFKACGKGFGQVLGLDIAALAENKAIFDNVFQLADVAWVIVAHENGQGTAGNADNVFALLCAEFFNEMVNEQGDVFLAFFERRQVDFDHIQAVKEVVAK